MNVLALAIPLTRLLDLTNFCTSATASSRRFVLNASADWQPLFTGNLRLLLVVFAHGSGFPLTDTTAHELWAVGFANIFALDKKVQDTHIATVIIHLELAARQS